MIIPSHPPQTSFDAGQKDVSDHDPHTIAGCIKMYLRELPEPLLKFELYSEWLKAAGLADVVVGGAQGNLGLANGVVGGAQGNLGIMWWVGGAQGT